MHDYIIVRTKNQPGSLNLPHLPILPPPVTAILLHLYQLVTLSYNIRERTSHLTQTTHYNLSNNCMKCTKLSLFYNLEMV